MTPEQLEQERAAFDAHFSNLALAGEVNDYQSAWVGWRERAEAALGVSVDANRVPTVGTGAPGANVRPGPTDGDTRGVNVGQEGQQ